MREAAERPFRCNTCGKRFKQTQGRNRHYREKHDPDLCLLCDVEWGRPYQYRDHLETHHPDVDPDTIMGKTEGSRRRAASFARHASQQQVLPPTIEHYGWGPSEIGPYPPMLPPPAVAKVPTVTPPAESAPQTMTMKISPEGAGDLDFIILLKLITPFLSIEEHAQTTGTTPLGAGGLGGLNYMAVGSPGWIC